MEFHMGGVRYPVMRNPVYGRRGMVSASQPLAAQAGISILKRGGNAVDAAIAAAACLAVTEPTSNGIGGDCFVQVWRNGRLYALNASGPAPALLSADVVREQGFDKMPERGWLPVTVPGVPAAWAELNERFGRLSLREDFDPAINCARRGFPVESVTAACWREAGEKMAPYADREGVQRVVPGIYKEWKDAGGRRDLGLRGYRQHTGIHCGKQRPVLLSLDAGRQDRRFFSENGRPSSQKRSGKLPAPLGRSGMCILPGLRCVGAAAQWSGPGGADGAGHAGTDHAGGT